jgi:hypothetical protein
LDQSAWIWTGVAAAVALLIDYIIAVTIWRNRNQVAAGKAWARTDGEVIASGVDVPATHDSDEEGDCRPTVRYRYTVGGKTHESDRIRFGVETVTTRMFAEQIAAKYPVGARVAVYYDPKRARNAVLEPKSKSGAAGWIGLIVFTALSAVLVSHFIAGKVLYTQGGVPLFAFLVPAAAIALAGVLVWNYFDIRQRKAESANWPTVQGRITTAEVMEQVRTDEKGREDTNYLVDIRFAYKVGGRELHSAQQKWGWDEVYPDRERPAAIVAKYSEGQAVPIYYDPTDPTVAVLEPTNRRGSAGPLMAAAMFLIPGVVMMWCLVAIA